MTAQTGDPQGRILSLIDYLEAYDARRNPPVYDIAKYGTYALRETDLPALPGIHLTPGADTWLAVDFVELPARPALPHHLDAVIGPADQISPDIRPVVRLDDEATDAELDLAVAAEEWIVQVWQPWADRHRDARTVKNLYRDLFTLRDQISTNREAVELVWGFGRLRWHTEDGIDVDHPLLTVPVEIDVVGSSNRLRVRPAGAVEVESACVTGLPLDDRKGYMAIRQGVATTEDATDPWDQATVDLLRRLVRAIDHDGVIAGDGNVAAVTASIDPSWVLFLRRRRPDYQGFLERMRDLYKQGALIPDPLQTLVVDAPSALSDDMTVDGESDSPHAEPLLLPLPTNEEQQRILALAQRRPVVTVQGPPGTGKSHTIANTISHYVAYGRRVLVVAEKEQALNVLADKLPEGIRDLAVSVLGSDQEGQRRLRAAIENIQTHVTALDKRAADERIEQLTGELDAVDREIAETAEKLLIARAAEIEHLDGDWVVGRDPSPSQAGDWAAGNAERLGYIDDEIPPSAKMPIDPAELADLVRLLQEMGIEKAEAAGRALPDLEYLPSGTDLARRFAELDAVNAVLEGVSGEIPSWHLIDAVDPKVLSAITDAVVAEHDWLCGIRGTWLERVLSQLDDPLLRGEWVQFKSDVEAEREQIITRRRPLAAHEIEVPEPDPEYVAALEYAHDRLVRKGKLGRFDRERREALEACTINGHTPQTDREARLCLDQLELEELRRRLATRWNKQIDRVGGPVVEGIIEDQLGDYVAGLNWVFENDHRWDQISLGIQALGVTVPARPNIEGLARLGHVMSVATRRPDQRALETYLSGLQTWLIEGAAVSEVSPLWGRLAGALADRRTEAWESDRATVADLVACAPQATRLRELRARLGAVAPVWTSRIVSDPGTASDPKDFSAAWQWRQIETWLSGIRRSGDPAALQLRLEDLSRQRRRVVTDLVTECAWRRLSDHLGDTQKQALNSYVAAMKRYGKTGGKYAARWLAEIRQALNESKDAVPVWIMPTRRALTSFRPDEIPPFDVLVIDEASQIGMDAIPLFSLARSAIVVGDDKQTSPENVGLERSAIFDLLDEHLTEVPKYRLLFDPDTSLYELALQKFPDHVMLTEHFRCLPPIIDFSNVHMYSGRIVPLRDRAPSRDWVPLRAVKVADGYRNGYVNEPEADAVTDLVEKMVADPSHDGMDIGVISLLGTDQSKVIWDKLYDRIGPGVMQERRIRCGEPASFQGDERDVMVISTVVAVDPTNPTGRIGAMTSRHDERRINVAASRARNQMWVVHSMDPDHLPTGDLRAALIRHCSQSVSLEEEYADLEGRCESDFERRALRRILARGYMRVFTQYPVGRFRLDIVIEGPQARLAVECDGDRWHGEDRWHADRARQEVLERAGWTFVRVRGSSFYRDPDTALEPLWARLDELGIPTGDDWDTAAPRAQVEVIRSRPPTRTMVEDVDADGDISGDAVSTPAEFVRPDVPDNETQPHIGDGGQEHPAPDAERPENSDASAPRGLERAVEGTTADTKDPEPPTGEYRRWTESANPHHRPHRDHPSASLLSPYTEWRPDGLVRPVPEATRTQLVDRLVEIVSTEGPIHVLRAFQLYHRASGGHRVGKDIRRALNLAMRDAIRKGGLAEIDDEIRAQEQKTLYMPGTPHVRVRTLGPRALHEVPRSEVKTLMLALCRAEDVDSEGLMQETPLGAPVENTAQFLRWERAKHVTSSSWPGLKRRVLQAYGLTKLTSRTGQYLDECIAYSWTSA